MRESLAAMNLDGDIARPSAAGGAMEAAGAMGASTAPANAPATQAQGAVVNVNPQMDAFEKNVGKLMAQHPELRQRYDEYLLARQRLDAAEGRGETRNAAQAGAAGR